MASLEELGACNPSDSMDEECITAVTCCVLQAEGFQPFLCSQAARLAPVLTFNVRLLAVVWVQGEHRGGKGDFDRWSVRGQTKERSHGAGP